MKKIALKFSKKGKLSYSRKDSFSSEKLTFWNVNLKTRKINSSESTPPYQQPFSKSRKVSIAKYKLPNSNCLAQLISIIYFSLINSKMKLTAECQPIPSEATIKSHRKSHQTQWIWPKLIVFTPWLVERWLTLKTSHRYKWWIL